MIKRPNDWENINEAVERRKLPAGAYVCRIRSAAIVDSDYGEQLQLVFDIESGEFAGYFNEEFRTNPSEVKKYKGVFRQFLPRDDGSEKDGWTKSSLKALITSVEKSNRGYLWNWDESSLKGKLVGIIFRNKEWEFNDKHGWTAHPYKACSVQSVEDGTFYQPRDKHLAKTASTSPTEGFTAPSTPTFNIMDLNDGDLPF